MATTTIMTGLHNRVLNLLDLSATILLVMTIGRKIIGSPPITVHEDTRHMVLWRMESKVADQANACKPP